MRQKPTHARRSQLRSIPQVALFMSPTLGYFANVALGVQEYARGVGGWSVEVCPTFPIANSSVDAWQPDGVLVNCGEDDFNPLLSRLSIPAVQVGGRDLNPPMPYRVMMDNVATGRLAATHFLERGFKNFAFCGYGAVNWSRQRQQAFCDALAEDGHTCHAFAGPPNSLHVAHLAGPLAAWLQSLPKPIAILAAHDRVAMLIGQTCSLLGVEVPDTVAILGVDNNPLECGFTSPPISSIMGSARRIGYQAAALLDRLMRREEVPPTSIPVAPAGIAERASTDVFAADDPDLVAALHFIHAHAGEPIDVSDVAAATIVTRRMLERKFRTHLNRSPREQILKAHLARAKDLLVNTRLSTLDTALRSGFPSASKFSAVFKRETGLTPTSFRKLYGGVL